MESIGNLLYLENLRGPDLEPVLEAQRAEWLKRLAWDNRKANDYIRRLLDKGRLVGLAAVVGGRPVGYGYFTVHGSKAVVQEVFVLPAERVPCHEGALLEFTVGRAFQFSGVKRVHGELASLDAFPERQMGIGGDLQVYPRQIMIRESCEALPSLSPVDPGMRFLPWTYSQFQPASELIAEAYVGHVDANFIEQYRSVSSADRFLEQTIYGAISGQRFSIWTFFSGRPLRGRLRGTSFWALDFPRTDFKHKMCLPFPMTTCSMPCWTASD